jgi:hypothetical protein
MRPSEIQQRRENLELRILLLQLDYLGLQAGDFCFQLRIELG